MADVPPLQAFGWSVVAVAVPTVLRWAIDVGDGASPFVTYYPALALAALFLGWRWGLAVAVASVAVANRMFGAQSLLDELLGPDGLIILAFALSCAILVLTGEMVRRLVHQVEGAKAREELLNAELMHRVKNLFATVNALATLTARHSTPADFPSALAGRMRALLRATELLGVDEKAHCEIHRLVDNALAAFRSSRTFTAEGPACELPREACVPLSLALHELCTNATKYGAMSVPGGRVRVHWALQDQAGQARLVLDWEESGGPPVQAPARVGFGTRLLQRGLQHDLGGTVTLDFSPAGVRCHIEAPLPCTAGTRS